MVASVAGAVIKTCLISYLIIILSDAVLVRTEHGVAFFNTSSCYVNAFIVVVFVMVFLVVWRFEKKAVTTK